MLCVPAESILVVSHAVPPTSGSGPRSAEPSQKKTEPVGTARPLPESLTVAVNFTACPGEEDLREDVALVLVGAPRTVTSKTFELLPAKL